MPRPAGLPWGAGWVGAPRPPRQDVHLPVQEGAPGARRKAEAAGGGGGGQGQAGRQAALGAGGVLRSPPRSPRGLGPRRPRGAEGTPPGGWGDPPGAPSRHLRPLLLFWRRWLRPWALARFLPGVLPCSVPPAPSRPGFGAWGFFGLRVSPNQLLPQETFRHRSSAGDQLVARPSVLRGPSRLFCSSWCLLCAPLKTSCYYYLQHMLDFLFIKCCVAQFN